MCLYGSGALFARCKATPGNHERSMVHAACHRTQSKEMVQYLGWVTAANARPLTASHGPVIMH